MQRILIIASGGTIASAKGMDGSLRPSLAGQEIIEMVPELASLAEIDLVQAMNIDSTNMEPTHWLRLAKHIEDAWDDYDGFVILHGTDTMAYSAAALSYLIQGSSKPIVLTGSQQPMSSPFTDAKLNVYQSVLYATDPKSAGVVIVFGGQVIVGTRARKQKTQSAGAFTSVNYPLPALIRYDKIVRDSQMGMLYQARLAEEAAAPKFFHTLDEDVAVLKLTPGLSPKVLSALMPTTMSLVLEIFGIGGIPSSTPAWQEALDEWVSSGRTLALTTQVAEEGLDLGVYEVGRAYRDNPLVIDGADMTTEALVAKIMWARGLTEDICEIRELVHAPINFDRSI